MKRWTALLLSAMLMLSLAACGGTETAEDSAQPQDDTIKIITTIFPEYDWMRNIIGEAPGVELDLLIDNGVDLHSFQPSVGDMVEISDCDVFIYTGGVSDDWVEEALNNATNKDMVVVNLMDVVSQHRETHLHEHEAGADEEHQHISDEHIWLSVHNAEFICQVLTDTMVDVDPDNADMYIVNLENYLEELATLDERYGETISQAKYDTVVFGDRFPFAYLADDYGLKYQAAFVGCSAETEVGFGTIAGLATTLDETGIANVLTIDGSDGKIAETVVSSTASQDQNILTMESMQAVTREQIDAGATWLGYMNDNLSVLEQALN